MTTRPGDSTALARVGAVTSPATPNSATEPTWTGRCSTRGFRLLSVGILLLLVGVGGGILFASGNAGGPAWVGWLLVVVGVVVAVSGWLLSSLEARVEPARFVVAFGPFGWPRRTIALADVRAVETAQIEPREWGGWGYRWNPSQHATAAVLRRGPGIVVALEDGRRFAVTVDDARDGAIALGHALEAARRR
jgi:hypothetical protein